MRTEVFPEQTEERVFYTSSNDELRHVGGFYYNGPDNIRFERQSQERDDDGKWVEASAINSPLSLEKARATTTELEEVIRHAQNPPDRRWRLVQLRWEPTLTIENTSVGVDSARLLLTQLKEAITEAEAALLQKEGVESQ